MLTMMSCRLRSCRRWCNSCTPSSSPTTCYSCSTGDNGCGDGVSATAAVRGGDGAAAAAAARTTMSAGVVAAAADGVRAQRPHCRSCRRCSTSAWLAVARWSCSMGPPRRSPVCGGPPSAGRRRHRRHRRRRRRSVPTWNASDDGRTATDRGRRTPTSSPTARCSDRPVQTRFFLYVHKPGNHVLRNISA